MNRIACPDCGSNLGPKATTCRCGWKASNVVDGVPQANCTWDGCKQKAVIREEIEPGKGKHNLCEYHYVEAGKLRAIRWCEARSLFTVEQKKEYCRKLSKRLLKPMREPGEDAEEKAA